MQKQETSSCIAQFASLPGVERLQCRVLANHFAATIKITSGIKQAEACFQLEECEQHDTAPANTAAGSRRLHTP